MLLSACEVFEFLIVYSSKIIIMKLYMFEFGSKDIHFASILKDDFVVELRESFFCFFNIGIFNKCFPNFSLLEN